MPSQRGQSNDQLKYIQKKPVAAINKAAPKDANQAANNQSNNGSQPGSKWIQKISNLYLHKRGNGGNPGLQKRH